MTTPLYSYSLWFHPGDAPSRRECPNTMSRTFQTEAERNADLAAYVADLEAQGYRVYKVAHETHCGGCSGTGTRHIPPKNWRKRTPPPWFLCKRTPCPDCDGRGTIDSAAEEAR